ncbi:MAG: hypothetical protein AAGG48_09945 [Planctomycetota bacterium]
MKSFGKSLGVRLAIGGATILSGVYAAALAQKDRQDQSESWSSDLPSLGQPVTPIEGQVPVSELQDAPPSLASMAADAFQSSRQPESDGAFSNATLGDSDGSVQLVQHTEPVDTGMELPASLGEPAADPPSVETPDWTLPNNTDGSAPATDSSAPSMTFPGSDVSPTPAATTMGAPVAVGGESPAMDLPVDLGPSVDAGPAVQTGPGLGAPSFNAGPSANLGPATDLAGDQGAGSGLPNAQLQTSPDMQFYAEDDVQYLSTGPEFEQPNAGTNNASIGAAAITGAAAGAFAGAVAEDVLDAGSAVVGAGEPANSLRSDQAGVNALRSGVTTEAPAMPGLAQQDPSFGQSVQTFDQTNAATPSATPNPPNFPEAGQSVMGNVTFSDPTPAPTTNAAVGSQGDYQAGDYRATGTPNAPQARIASLPSHSDPGYAADPSMQNIQGNQGYPQTQDIQSNPGYAQSSPGYPQPMQQPSGALPIQPDATFDAPGERRLEGAQTPSVIIQKRAPAEVKVGKPAAFVIQVQNVGSVEALNVQVHDRIPAGMRLVDASPNPVQQGGLLVWQLGAMPAGDERTLTMQLVPEQEGELGSVARVSFEAAASVRTVATRPELRVSQRAPETVLIGQQLEIELEVSNPGSGEATGVVLQEDVPEGLDHPKGRKLDNALGNLAPGEIRKQVLRLRAVAPGVIQNTIRLSGDDGLAAEHTVSVQVVAPDLRVELKGPNKRYLERQTTYQLDVANAGTADATNVELSVQLARGFTFVSTDFEGQYDPSRHAVFWSLAQLPAGQSGSVPLTLLPVEEGEQAIVIDARADLGVTAHSERKMSVEGFAELNFEITNPGGPIEVGAETVYQVRVTNKGSKPDTNIRVQLQLPQGLELISADSEAGTDGRGLIAFQPRASLAPGEELSYKLRLRGTGPGTHLVKAVVVSDQNTVPVTKEESSKVYTDQ